MNNVRNIPTMSKVLNLTSEARPGGDVEGDVEMTWRETWTRRGGRPGNDVEGDLEMTWRETGLG